MVYQQSSTGIFAAQASRVLKRQQNCKNKVSIHSGDESGCEKDLEAYEGDGVFEYRNIGVLGFERLNPSFHPSTIPIFYDQPAT